MIKPKKLYLSNTLVYIAENMPETYVRIDLDGRDKSVFGKVDKDGEFLKDAILTLKCNPIVYEWTNIGGFDRGLAIKCRLDV